MNPYLADRQAVAEALDDLMNARALETDTHQIRRLEGAIEALWPVWERLKDGEAAWESERPRREAETRLAYHLENDTLDLY